MNRGLEPALSGKRRASRILIGEQGRWSSLQMHVESVNRGYAGTFCWAYFDNRADSEGTWADAQAAVRAIAAQLPAAISGE